MAEPDKYYPLDTYQNQAHRFAAYGDASSSPIYPFAGLAEEAGEVAGKIAKFIRKNGGHDPFTVEGLQQYEQARSEFVGNVAKELGDCLWMIAECANVIGLSLSQIAADNIAKLDDRKNRGVIVGEGDTIEERIANSRKSE